MPQGEQRPGTSDQALAAELSESLKTCRSIIDDYRSKLFANPVRPELSQVGLAGSLSAPESQAPA